MAPWTSTEDAKLLAQIAIYGTKDQWRQIAEAIPGRTNKACRKRWLHSLCPDVKKTLWTAEEDEKLLTLHNMYPGRWAIIARHIDGRTDDACSKRYREALDPTLCRNEWTPEEDQRLLVEVETWKTQWTKVGHAMNRSGLACRNRYRMLQRRRETPAAVDPTHEWHSYNVAIDSPSMDHDIDVQWPQDPFQASPVIDPLATQPRSAWQPTPNVPVDFAIDPALQQMEQPSFVLNPTPLVLDGPASSSSPQPIPSVHDVPLSVEPQSMDMSRTSRDLDGGLQGFYNAIPVADPSGTIPPFHDDGDASESFGEIDDTVPPAMEDVQMQIDDNVAEHSRPAKRRRTSNPAKRKRAADDARNAADSCRLSATRSVTADAAILAYACGSGACSSLVEAEMSAGLPTSPACVRFATSAELLSHKKTLHPDDESDKLYRCGLPGCGKRWKNVNGLQYHLQVSRAHFQIAVNRAKSAVSVDPEVDAENGRPKKPFQCPQDGCPNSYKQLSGLRYHLTHGHPQTIPVQLEELPPQLRRRVASTPG